MNGFWADANDGYGYSIKKGLSAAGTAGRLFAFGKDAAGQEELKLKRALSDAEAVVIGAGAGLSTAAGLTYSGERFDKYFFDFRARFGITDMYTGGFYPFPDRGTRWAWWARHIYFNRYTEPPVPVYRQLSELVKDKDHFVITTNVDHCFQRAGFGEERLFFTQGDYGLFQSEDPADRNTYPNEDWVMRAMEAQGFIKNASGEFDVPKDGRLSMRLSDGLIPVCPGGKGAAMNLRADDTFVEDASWHKMSKAYLDFLKRHEGARTLFLEIGVGGNTPVIIKYPFWAFTLENPKAMYACVNFSEAYCPEKLLDRSICIDGDAAGVVRRLLGNGDE